MPLPPEQFIEVELSVLDFDPLTDSEKAWEPTSLVPVKLRRLESRFRGSETIRGIAGNIEFTSVLPAVRTVTFEMVDAPAGVFTPVARRSFFAFRYDGETYVMRYLERIGQMTTVEFEY